MRASLALFVFLVILLVPGACKEPSLSSGELFAVVSPESRRAAALSRVLSEYERRFLSLTGFAPGAWPPVLVILHDQGERTEGLPALRVDEIEGVGGCRVQVDLAEGQESTRTGSRLIAQALLLREYYANLAPPSGSRIVTFPEWLLRGLGRLCNPSTQGLPIPTSYLRGETPPTIGEFLTQNPPPDGSQTLGDLYDTMAATLLKAGLKPATGQSAFASWIGRFDPKNPGQPVPAWPEGWSQSAVERRWLLLMAGEGGARSGAVSILGPDETLARYDAILAGVKTPGHSLALLRKEKECGYTAKKLAQQLGALRLQANPLGIPTIEAAFALCSNLPRFSPNKAAREEVQLAALREEWVSRSRGIEAHLDWYEAMKVPVRSGLFDRLLETPEPPVNKGPVGRYLDAVEARGW